MYGQYSRQLGEFAKLEGLKQAERRRLKEEKARKKELRGYQGKLLHAYAKTMNCLISLKLFRSNLFTISIYIVKLKVKTCYLMVKFDKKKKIK